jgi:hypothetical protein
MQATGLATVSHLSHVDGGLHGTRLENLYQILHLLSLTPTSPNRPPIRAAAFSSTTPRPHTPVARARTLPALSPLSHTLVHHGASERKKETGPALVTAPTSTPANLLCHPSLTRSPADLNAVPSRHSVACPARRERPGAGLAIPAACTRKQAAPCFTHHGTVIPSPSHTRSTP